MHGRARRGVFVSRCGSRDVSGRFVWLREYRVLWNRERFTRGPTCARSCSSMGLCSIKRSPCWWRTVSCARWQRANLPMISRSSSSKRRKGFAVGLCSFLVRAPFLFLLLSHSQLSFARSPSPTAALSRPQPLSHRSPLPLAAPSPTAALSQPQPSPTRGFTHGAASPRGENFGCFRESTPHRAMLVEKARRREVAAQRHRKGRV